MFALSLLQPWASLVILGHKKIETRNWSTAYRGRLWIHASKGKAAKEITLKFQRENLLPLNIPYGFVLGSVLLSSVKPFNPETDHNYLTLEEGVFGEPLFSWHFENPIPLPYPLPARGSMRLWNFEGPEKIEDYL